jgi:bacillithiol biosynthesis cysteine-adding enzyme BshC
MSSGLKLVPNALNHLDSLPQIAYILHGFLFNPGRMRMQRSIEFNDMPAESSGFSSLFVDYVTAHDRVAKYYNGHFADPSRLRQVLELVGRKAKDRSTLVRVLAEQNREFYCSIKTLANIDLLHEDNTFAVVTGQQVGLLGGPLYTIYKIITTLKLTDRLNNDLPECRFVPIFWLEAEDHDFEEVNNIKVVDPENKAQKIEYLLEGKPLDRNIGSVGELQLDGFIDEFFKHVEDALINTEFKAKLFETLRHYYQHGSTFTKSFVGLINHLFENSGLIFIKPTHGELKKLMSPIFQREINEHPKVCQLVIERSAELEQRYHAQVKAKALNLFLLEKGGRHLIEPREDGFGLKGARRHLTIEELRSISSETPELLSPNVVLRPICQDTLLPTAVYVGGPNEIAYFAQLKPVYEFFDLTMPIIYPRATATILEEKLESILEKFELDLTAFFGNLDSVLRTVSEQISDIKVEDMFQTVGARVKESLNELKFGINQIDPTLLGALDTSASKIEFQLNVLKEKTVNAQKKKNEIALKQVEKVANNTMPFGELQERQINVTYFMNKYGLDFVKWLTEELRIDLFQHQVIHL